MALAPHNQKVHQAKYAPPAMTGHTKNAKAVSLPKPGGMVGKSMISDPNNSQTTGMNDNDIDDQVGGQVANAPMGPRRGSIPGY